VVGEELIVSVTRAALHVTNVFPTKPNLATLPPRNATEITCTSRQQPHNENWATRSLAERSAVSAHQHLGTIHPETYSWNNSAARVFLNRQCKENSHYERKRFVLDYNSNLCPMAELCRQYAIVGNASYPYSAPRQQEWA
jgi:hypothetical protein